MLCNLGTNSAFALGPRKTLIQLAGYNPCHTKWKTPSSLHCFALLTKPYHGNNVVCVVLMLWPMVSRPIHLGVGQIFGAHDQIFLFPFFCRTIVLLFVLGPPLWREDGSVICSAICQWSESRKTHNHTLLSRLRLLGSLSFASYDSQGLWWKYSNPTPNGK
jgi:hypothetical protein